MLDDPSVRIATGVTFVALLLSLSQNLLVMLLASLAAALAGTIHLISFFIQIALFARVKDKMDGLDIGASSKPGPGTYLLASSPHENRALPLLLAPVSIQWMVADDDIPSIGFWLVFVSLILCFLAACTVCFGRRRDQAHARTANAIATGTLPSEKSGGFFSRFRR